MERLRFAPIPTCLIPEPLLFQLGPMDPNSVSNSTKNRGSGAHPASGLNPLAVMFPRAGGWRTGVDSRAHLHVGREAAGPCKPPSPFSTAHMGKLSPESSRAWLRSQSQPGAVGAGNRRCSELSFQQHSGASLGPHLLSYPI